MLKKNINYNHEAFRLSLLMSNTHNLKVEEKKNVFPDLIFVSTTKKKVYSQEMNTFQHIIGVTDRIKAEQNDGGRGKELRVPPTLIWK